MSNNNIELVKLLIDRIDRSSQQQITFAEYMEIVSHDREYGYYATNSDRIGIAGDFLTSPHLGSDFGELLAIQFHQMWQILGESDRFTLLELGAGQGILALQILTYIQVNYPQFMEAIDYQIVENSPAMILSQSQKLAGFPVSWNALMDLPDNAIVGCCFSNEFFDALPVHQIIKRSDRLAEIYLTKGIEPELFREVIGELSDARLAADYWHLNGINLLTDRYAEGYRTEVNLAALDWLQLISRKLDRGYVLTIDYGYTADRYYNPMRNGGTLQAYDRHRHHNNPYINIGNQDLTAHVDFTALERFGNTIGLIASGFTYQGILLMALGIGDRLANISNATTNMQQTLERRQYLHQLIDPQGLGRFGVLIQHKNLTETESSIGLQGLAR
jgi:SAM-dependent MidA family methyltransferase